MSWNRHRPYFAVAMLAMAMLSGSSATAADRTLSEISVYPPEVSLKTAKSRQTLVVQARYADGVTEDVTAQAEFQLPDSQCVKLDGTTLLPNKDGEGQLVCNYQGKTASIPVKVAEATTPRPVSFHLDVMPVFMRAGCNTGSCHGAARGKDGFMLSLFGYDPKGDHQRITREQLGRRINLAVPEKSMLIQKGAGQVPHTGGKCFDVDSIYYRDLVEWVSNRCPQDPDDVPYCTDLKLYPEQAVLDGAGATQQLTAIAFYSDGTQRDVTDLAIFQSNNDNSAEVDPKSGLVTAGKRGEAFVMARFATETVGSQFIVLPKGLVYEPSQEKPVNYVDELVMNKLIKLRMNPSEVCTDEVFIRRIYIDMVGMVPTPEEYRAFVADTDPDKRAKLIDKLLEQKEFTEMWVSKWAEWLMMRSSNQVSYKSILLYYNWLSERIADNTPLNEMVIELLTKSGGTFSEPATNFYEVERDTLKVAENVAQVFMGMRIQCAQCHNHPFDRWTQNDYYNFAAFFSQIGRKQAEDPRESIIYNRGGGEVKHPVTNQNATPIFLGGRQPDVRGKDRREVLAKWLASPENPYFAENFVNRIWQHFMGTGIIDPVDDIRVSNPPTNPALLKELARRFTESGYDYRALIRDICNSNTYQRSTIRNESNATDETNFAHQNSRRIKAESMLDIISQVTNTKDKFRGLPLGSRAVQISDGVTSNYFLTTFGRATRETVCSCEVKMDPSLSQALHLLNGDTVNRKIGQGGVLKQYAEQKLPADEVITDLYVRCLSRSPKEEELAKLRPLFAEGNDYNHACEDVFWALLNSREFIFNH
ncbi:MAG: DUF1549 domain-containing protein [Rubinisphaera brasiliensis]|uniref:Cytochrome c domain-containing protein n=1 Tax=Rubinisphaera brasiliensis (strain ATCC 49424 / DSM 5305 / JCM 21570 / IAM 15109 / NBRC 103401 / IFAM 1448) TaxID=756272 RepID=F0SL42_RUBBR|nr:DUF1549 and DUF1553 domain-containing protein [Rubinisphaera brasiliensis]ADY60925.1 protein of unknown function DUF1549 [Rubinisphaera brasiliensis DSM 5305]